MLTVDDEDYDDEIVIVTRTPLRVMCELPTVKGLAKRLYPNDAAKQRRFIIYSLEDRRPRGRPKTPTSGWVGSNLVLVYICVEIDRRNGRITPKSVLQTCKDMKELDVSDKLPKLDNPETIRRLYAEGKKIFDGMSPPFRRRWERLIEQGIKSEEALSGRRTR